MSMRRAAGVTKFIKTGVGDKNNYPLYFEKVIYEVDIDENVEINHNFLNHRTSSANTLRNS
uniref:Uncharacterized protein n=1 Tax=Anopheles quadriannulatus TaxID=34691 RepID=A0A182XPK1_ANOQN